MKVLKNFVCLLFLGCVFSVYCFSQTVNNGHITIEITNVVINNGRVYLTVCSNENNFRNGISDFEFILEANNVTISHEVSLKNGEYVISAYQDANNNGKLDYELFGVPKELVGMSNYFGKGYPSKSFNKQKILIDNSTGKVTIGLYKF